MRYAVLALLLACAQLAFATPITVHFAGNFGTAALECGSGGQGEGTDCGKSFSGWYTYDNSTFTSSGGPFGLVIDVEGVGTFVSHEVTISTALYDHYQPPVGGDPEFPYPAPAQTYTIAASGSGPESNGFRLFIGFLGPLSNSYSGTISDLSLLPDLTTDFYCIAITCSSFSRADPKFSTAGPIFTAFTGRSFDTFAFADHVIPVQVAAPGPASLLVGALLMLAGRRLVASRKSTGQSDDRTLLVS